MNLKDIKVGEIYVLEASYFTEYYIIISIDNERIGSICEEHKNGIIRSVHTPYLHNIKFSKLYLK